MTAEELFEELDNRLKERMLTRPAGRGGNAWLRGYMAAMQEARRDLALVKGRCG